MTFKKFSLTATLGRASTGDVRTVYNTATRHRIYPPKNFEIILAEFQIPAKVGTAVIPLRSIIKFAVRQAIVHLNLKPREHYMRHSAPSKPPHAKLV